MNNIRTQGIVKALAIVVAVLCSVATLDTALADNPVAPAPVPQQQDAPEEGTPVSPTPIAPIGLLSPTVSITLTAVPTSSTAITASVDSVNANPGQQVQTDDQVLESEDTPPEQDSGVGTASAVADSVSSDTPETVTDAVASNPLVGAIAANRTNYAARFFLEGQVYNVGPFASVGFDVPRITAVLNLYTCDADTPETQADCYWDPYLVQSDVYYEVFDDSTVVGLPKLMLRDANTPPDDQVWIHNRTGITESVVFRDIVYEVSPGLVQEFDVEPGAPVIVYVRSCGRLNEKELCEWAPQSLEPGAYFAMVEVSTPGGIPGSRIVTVDLRPVVDAGGQAITAPTKITCQLNVPAVNIRSGPGLQYQIVGKIRESQDAPGSVAITGRSVDDLWYAVAESVAPNGWVTSNTDFMTCSGNTEDLPLAEFSGALLAPAPTPIPVSPPQIVQQPQQVPQATSESDLAVVEEPTVAVTEAVTATDTSAPQPPAIPEGHSLLIINNGFEFPIRFTLDQKYRQLEGPSEFDLEPSGSTSVVVYPGTIAFSASTPWNVLSGNAVLEMEPDQPTYLWLRFVPDPDGSSNWDLAWE